MRTVALYGPALVLFIWAAVWALGVTGDVVMIIGLLATGASVVLHIEEQLRRRRGYRRSA